ncbi:amidohydrolase [Bordetella holmesii]|nr:M20 family metallopeptidase [Bordetella holmesii]AMD47301.1 amidohydrolase [Bordetella holmesii H558]AMD49077.1 peptidase M20 [Bordetella holmesii F627]AOB37247.1 amidohydrolase [Bordetella holmesii]AUL21190.1 amidohydrolase [Bordetella holmesii]AUL24529.1 amidohydrolase [Bordetella holmesii]
MQSLALLDDFFARETPRMTGLADKIWSLAELRYAETASADLHRQALQAAGFRITSEVAGIATAFMAEWGDEGPVLAFLGEYDALSGLNQQSGALVCTPSVDSPGMAGHGCGHHLLGTSAHFAALAVQEHLRRSGAKARIRYYGCPAEEGGAGKTFMARAGVFDDVDTALTWHPGSFTGLFSQATLANIQVRFIFHGRAAHAGHSPHLGRSALDAVELMNVGVNYLREHMPTDARVHYAITDAGGLSPNVVQARAEVVYLIRARNNNEAADLYRRVRNIARGAELMTECRLEVVFEKACSNLMQNRTLNQVMYAQMQALGQLSVDAEQRRLAGEFQATLDASDVEQVSRPLASVLRGKVPSIFDGLVPYDPLADETLFGSTDVADVSWVTPTAQAWVACYAFGTPLHSWQMVSQGQLGLAHAGMVHASRILAATGIALLDEPELMVQAQQELLERRGGQPYVCPIPADVPVPGRRAGVAAV